MKKKTTTEAPPAPVKTAAETEADKLESTDRLLSMHKFRHAQAVARGDEDVQVSELAIISKLEIQLENREAFARLKALTAHTA